MPTKITEHIGKYNCPLEADNVVLIQNSLDFRPWVQLRMGQHLIR